MLENELRQMAGFIRVANPKEIYEIFRQLGEYYSGLTSLEYPSNEMTISIIEQYIIPVLLGLGDTLFEDDEDIIEFIRDKHPGIDVAKVVQTIRSQAEIGSFIDEINRGFREVHYSGKLFFETQGRRVYPIELTEDGQFYGKLTRTAPITDRPKSIDGLKKAISDYVGQKKDLIVWSVYPEVEKYGDGYAGYCVLYAE